MAGAIYFRLGGAVFATCYVLYAAASGFSVVFCMTEQELNSPDVMTQAAGLLNMFSYLAVAVFSVLTGMLLDSFGGSKVEGSVIYSHEAYLTLFLLLLIPTALSLILGCFIPETNGKYKHHADA